MTLSDHLPILPIIIPALAAPIALLVMRRRRALGIVISLASCLAMLAAALGLLLSGHKVRQQRLHGGREIAGVGFGLCNQRFIQSQVDRTFAGLLD